MRIFKNHPLLSLTNRYLIDAPQPSNLNYSGHFLWLLAFCLIIQSVTGVMLEMHYNPSVAEAFNSVEHIMRDVNNGSVIRYFNFNIVSIIFFLVYIHIGRGLYYGSYKAPRTLVWTIGTIILVLMMATGFLIYIFSYTQLSLWGATVITNLMSAIPWVGEYIIKFLWGGFSVNNATLNRFFALILSGIFFVIFVILMYLRNSAGSGNPLGISGNYDRLPFPRYTFMNFIIMFLLSLFLLLVLYTVIEVFFFSNTLYAMDDITESKSNLEAIMLKVQNSLNYWHSQAILLDFEFKESLTNGSREVQDQILQAKKESERHWNSDSLLLRHLQEKYASGQFKFSNTSILGKRPLDD